MRKNCYNCKYYALDYYGTRPCAKCTINGDEAPSFWEASGNYAPMTNADRIRAMSDEEMAEFIMLSPEMEFSVCECCDVFRGHGTSAPCGTEDGWCRAELRCNAFKIWLQQPCEEV